jgi:hypothetical protein
MKRILLLCILSLITWVIPGIKSSAQVTNGDKVTVQITKDGKVITDTVFQLKEGQDPDAVKKVIGRILEGDIQVISGKEGHQKMVWVTKDDDKHMWDAEEMEMDMDSVVKHEGKVMVLDGGSGEGSKIIIIEEKGHKDCEDHPKHVKVYVEGDNDMEILNDEDFEWVEKDADNVDVYVIKKDDGTEVVKTVKVEVKVDEENDKVTNEVTEPTQKESSKPEKKKK